ncbi:helix-turn-helix domain-containing protein [Nocardioides sp. GY 10127]|uniref:helix-turn-helix domain-containing protein n=1 Tax=Nocardioides sp. GY 10127 TaxID=2569762 RepID=UPI0010A94697|nr:helix-turn-helix domain-containing protein [Nocardioides sp. GY 10127]TIC81930.1 helix-turn-helix domain-containing protein [Nocardioides sp. GY 10127]
MPATTRSATSLPVEDDAGRLGERLRALRRARGMTLVQLAELAGLSHPFLSQLERGLARPSMASLERISRALGLSQVELLTFADQPAPSASPTVLRGPQGVHGRYGEGEARLLMEPGSAAFSPMEVTGENTEWGHTWSHAEAEWLYVVLGHVEVELGDTLETLSPGDSAVCPGGTPHRWRSADGDLYRLIVVKEQLRHP